MSTTLTNILILDTETTGTGDDADPIEVACILFSVEHAAVLRSYGSLIRAEHNPAHAINRIPEKLLSAAPEASKVWAAVRSVAGSADAFVAHKAEFDGRFVPQEVTAGRPWICSMNDLAWPLASRPGEGLVSLALAHGLGVAHAHRAMADCDMLARLFSRVAEMGVDLQAFLARGLRPKATFQALVPFERKDEAAAAGFKWDGATRRWLRTMAIDDVGSLPFQVRRAA